jgi:hypothetical protein
MLANIFKPIGAIVDEKTLEVKDRYHLRLTSEYNKVDGKPRSLIFDRSGRYYVSDGSLLTDVMVNMNELTLAHSVIMQELFKNRTRMVVLWRLKQLGANHLVDARLANIEKIEGTMPNRRIVFATAHGCVFVPEQLLGSQLANYHVALPPTSEPVSLAMSFKIPNPAPDKTLLPGSAFTFPFVQTVPLSPEMIDDDPMVKAKRGGFLNLWRQILMLPVEEPNDSDQFRLRLYPLFYQAGATIIANKEGSYGYERRYTLEEKTNRSVKWKSGMLPVIFVPVEEMIATHAKLLKQLFTYESIVLWQFSLSKTFAVQDRVIPRGTYIDAKQVYLDEIDFVTDEIRFRRVRNIGDELSVGLNKFLTNDGPHKYRMLLLPTNQPRFEQTLPAQIAAAGILTLEQIAMNGITDDAYAEGLFDQSMVENDVGVRDRVIRRLVQVLDAKAKDLTRIAIKEAELVADEHKMEESQAASTGMWSAFCKNDYDLIGDPIKTISDRADLVSILPPNGGAKGTCYRRSHLFRMMTKNIVYKWPRQEDPTKDINFYRVDPGYWVTHESLQRVIQTEPRISLFQLRLVGKEKVGTTYGVSTIHGEEYPIHELVPLKARDPVIADLKHPSAALADTRVGGFTQPRCTGQVLANSLKTVFK